jgi:DNA-binding NarL/FixJ family response regulator
MRHTEQEGKPLRVMLASSRAQLAASWLERLAGEPGIELDAQPAAESEALARRLWNGHSPDVLLLDQALLGQLDAQALDALHARLEALRVLLLCDEPGVAAAEVVLRHRFHGCLPTQCPREVCAKAIRAVLRGELWLPRALLAEVAAELLHQRAPPPGGHEHPPTLTPREQQIVEHLRRGHTNKEIAQGLGIREDTVKKHLRSVFGKLGVHRRTLVAMRPR